MSSSGEHLYQYGIRCDHAGCKAAIWRLGVSEQHAHTLLQADAKAAGWLVSPDRLYSDIDRCPEHKRYRGP